MRFGVVILLRTIVVDVALYACVADDGDPAVVFAFGSLFGQGWPGDDSSKCASMSNAWYNKEGNWENGECGLNSMHILCDEFEETWRRKVGDRCNAGSDLWNRDEKAQANVAKQMCALTKKPKFVMNTGDNFQFEGIGEGDGDGRFEAKFEQVYKCLWNEGHNVPFLSTLGPVDYGNTYCEKRFGGFASSEELIKYDKEKDWQYPKERSGHWVLPDRKYKKTFRFHEEGVSLDVFVIDTNLASVDQNCWGQCADEEGPKCEQFFKDNQKAWEDWLDAELPKSTANWRVVMGHHHFTDIKLLSVFDGSVTEDFTGQAFLELLAKHDVAVYVAGGSHMHQQRLDQILELGESKNHTVFQVVTSAGGGYQSLHGGKLSQKFVQFNATTLWTAKDAEPVSYGFAAFSFRPKTLQLTFYSDEGKEQKIQVVPAIKPFRGDWQIGGEWPPCPNACTRETQTIERGPLECSTEFPSECDPDKKPETQKRMHCIPDTEEKPIMFCDKCDLKATTCSACASGFHFDEGGGSCENDAPFAKVDVDLHCRSVHDDTLGRIGPDFVKSLFPPEDNKLSFVVFDARLQSKSQTLVARALEDGHDIVLVLGFLNHNSQEAEDLKKALEWVKTEFAQMKAKAYFHGDCEVAENVPADHFVEYTKGMVPVTTTTTTTTTTTSTTTTTTTTSTTSTTTTTTSTTSTTTTTTTVVPEKTTASSSGWEYIFIGLGILALGCVAYGIYANRNAAPGNTGNTGTSGDMELQVTSFQDSPVQRHQNQRGSQARY